MEKNEYLKTYVLNIVQQLRASGITVTGDQLNYIKNKYSSSTDSLENILKEIDSLVSQIKENYEKRRKDQIKKANQLSSIKDLQNLSLEFMGITLDNQDVDLLLIAGSDTPIELQDALKQVSNIDVDLPTLSMSDDEFITLRQQMYNMYINTLSPVNDAIKDQNLSAKKKMTYLLEREVITEEQIEIIENLLLSDDSATNKLNQVLSLFSKEQFHKICVLLANYIPIERDGKIATSLEAYRNLLKEIKNRYNSITIDDEAKYQQLILLDGTYDFTRLNKMLSFAKRLNKKVRLNLSINYNSLSIKEESSLNSRLLAKESLIDYYDILADFIKENEYEDIVRSIDVFNELLNLDAVEGDRPYKYKGDFDSDIDNVNFSDISPGVLRFLSVDDICDALKVMKKKLPDMDFVYNEFLLEDSKKRVAFFELMRTIKEYEERHNIKLIDCVGTQMHIDNNITKDCIKNEFLELNRLNLPIEITEFDLAMTREVENLSADTIERIRQLKINEVFDSISEVKEAANIKGLTIWSKTDKQNFRVFVANEERIKNGQEPIETLYGGMYTENMESKAKSLVKQNQFQNFNYHTHTKRCGHAGLFSDREYVLEARKNGISQLGFSDHVPYTFLEYPDTYQRMYILEINEYITSIKELQNEYSDISILCGFEAEFSPMNEDFLGKLRDKVDYLILGQHFVKDGLYQVAQENNPNYPLEYANMVCKAMDSGLFDIVAHPDIFMKFRDSILEDERKKLFEANALKASLMICKKAKELNIPLEINFAGIDKEEILQDGEFSYPHSLFWNIAGKIKSPVLYGVDAHSPGQFLNMGECRAKVDTFIDTSKLNIVESGYNPVKEREKNKKLQELYNREQAKSLTYETHLVCGILSEVLRKIPDDAEADIIGETLDQVLKNMSNVISRGEETLQEENASKIESISNNDKLSIEEKTFMLKKAKDATKNIRSALTKRKEALTRARQSVETAMEIGCETKDEYRKVVSDLTEIKSQENPTKKEKVTVTIQNFIEQKNLQSLTTFSSDSNKSKVKTKKLGTNSVTSTVKSNKKGTNAGTGPKGFASIISLVLIITQICILGVVTFYILSKFIK